MRGRDWILITAFISGFSIFINKLFVNSFNAFQFTTLKNVSVALILMAFIGLGRNIDKIKKLKRKDIVYLIIIGVTGGSVPFLLFFYALQFTAAASAAFVHKMMFVFASIFAFIFLKEKMNKKQILSSLILFAGVSLMFNLTGLEFGMFDLIILFATIMWALEATISKKVLEHIDPQIVAFGRMGFGAVVMLSFIILSGNASIAIDGSNLISIAVASIILFGYVFTWYHGLQKVSVNTATTILMLGSVITSMIQMDISFSMIIGSILVFSAVLLNISATNKRSSKWTA